MAGRPRMSAAERIATTSVVTPDGCHKWTGDNNGRYGVITFGGKRRLAHRFTYEHTFGPIPTGMVVMHSCDNPLCVNTAHLSVGTMHDNTQDMLQKGRHYKQKQTHCPSGHEMDAANTMIRKSENGARRCRKCYNAKRVRQRARRKLKQKYGEPL